MLQTLAGGAAARPFVTTMNALSINLFMRIAPELYLKRLLVGGMGRVFEINRNFRNEGLDKQHNPEFTMLELYHAFGDVRTVMDVTEELVRTCARFVAKRAGLERAVLPFGELRIDYERPFERVAYGALFLRALGFPMNDIAMARQVAREKRVLPPDAIDKIDPALLINELFEEFAEKTVDPARPTFITDYPAAISPLTRPKPEQPELADRADLFIAGMEIAPHYTELNDPDVQEQRFREQLATGSSEKDAEERTFRTMDHDFIQALKVGMPPAGGMGLGVDRLTMLLTDQRTIRDVVLFPLMRPES
jgi:lysyl-tRNA synthetase class 2